MITESCLLNPNRNPGVTRADCQARLKALLGLDKISQVLPLKIDGLAAGGGGIHYTTQQEPRAG